MGSDLEPYSDRLPDSTEPQPADQVPLPFIPTVSPEAAARFEERIDRIAEIADAAPEAVIAPVWRGGNPLFLPGSSNGRTSDFGSENEGSSPSPGANND